MAWHASRKLRNAGNVPASVDALPVCTLKAPPDKQMFIFIFLNIEIRRL